MLDTLFLNPASSIQHPDKVIDNENADKENSQTDTQATSASTASVFFLAVGDPTGDPTSALLQAGLYALRYFFCSLLSDIYCV